MSGLLNRASPEPERRNAQAGLPAHRPFLPLLARTFSLLTKLLG
jgi:hypothetical protein